MLVAFLAGIPPGLVIHIAVTRNKLGIGKPVAMVVTGVLAIVCMSEIARLIQHTHPQPLPALFAVMLTGALLTPLVLHIVTHPLEDGTSE